MNYTAILSGNVCSDIQKLKKSGEQPALKKLNKLLDELEKHPRTGTGKPEQKKIQLKGILVKKNNGQTQTPVRNQRRRCCCTGHIGLWSL